MWPSKTSIYASSAWLISCIVVDVGSRSGSVVNWPVGIDVLCFFNAWFPCMDLRKF